MDRAVVYAATRNYYEYLPTTINSLIKHNPHCHVYVLAEDDEIPCVRADYVSVINVNRLPKYFDPKGPNYDSKWTQMTLYRVALPKFIYEDKALWLDVDTLVQGNIERLWDMDMTGYYVAAVAEEHKTRGELPHHFVGHYFNAGVMLMNLDLMRHFQLADRMIHLLNINYYRFPDQDILNICCNDYCLWLPSDFNACLFTAPASQTIILHYAACAMPMIKATDTLWREAYCEKLGATNE